MLAKDYGQSLCVSKQMQMRNLPVDTTEMKVAVVAKTGWYKRETFV